MTERLNQQSDFDVLGDILETLRFRGSIFFRSDLAAPWGMSSPEMGIPRFHIALSGDCFVGAEDHQSIKEGKSEIVMRPNGDSHWIADRPGRKLVPSERAGEACELGGPLFQHGEITNSLMCGMVRFDEGAAHPILEALPAMMHFPMLESSESIWSTISLIDAEMRSRQNTNNRIADRLTEVLFLQLLNHYVSHGNDSMSRATLVRRFQDVVGVAPMAYIMDWRLMKAHELIKHTMQSLEQIAHATGFASAGTLSRAFKRHYGCTPHKSRRSQHEA